MGNPCRYFIDGKMFGKPLWDQDKKQLVIKQYIFHGESVLLDSYETMKIDFYSAPDVIMTYTNGNTCKDEFRRYSRDVLANVKLVKKDFAGEYTAYTYSYEEVTHQWFNWDDPECETDIPLGKFQGKTYKEVQNYKRKNRSYFKGETLQPSPEAIEAACAAQSLGLEAMLIAAYKIDM